jgi:hypothetical protein
MIEEKSVVQRILRPFLLLALLIAATAGLVACGGGDGDGGGSGGQKTSEDTDATTVVKNALTSTKKITKGKMDLSFKLSATGSSGGSFEGTVSGPFESQGATKPPKVDLDVSFSGGGQNIKAGAVHTGSKAFVNFNGTDYAVDDATYKQFVQGYEQSAKQNQGNANEDALQKLGIDPAKWLKDPKNAGEGDVEGEDVIKATGAVDIPTMLKDVNTLISKAGSLGLGGSANVPSQLTDAQIKQVQDAVKQADVEIDAAKSDGTLRRAVIKLNAVNPDKSSDKIDGELSITLSDVNESQDFPEPSGAKPLSQLLQQFGGLGGLGGASAGGASGSGSSGSSSADQQKLKDYSDCIQAAGSDTAKAQACAEKLR